MKPKILYIVKRFSGGIFTYLQYMSDRLIENYDITIAYSTTSETPENFRKMFSPDVNLRRVESFSESSKFLSFQPVKQELRKIVKEEAPDLIHLHGHGAGKFGRRALEDLNIPLLYTPHGYLYLAEDHNILSRSIERMNEESDGKIDCLTVACSKGEYAESLGLTKRSMYINNGIDTKEIDSILASITVEPHPTTVYTSGLINEQKNPELFNEIAQAMPQVRFVWIGDGEQKYKLTSKNVEVTGWLPRHESIQIAAQSDIFIQTSLWEGLSISLLEAMYLKKLCVVNNVVGSRDVIRHTINGYVCDNAAAFVNVLNNAKQEDIIRITETAHQEIIDQYDVEKMVKAYDQLYQKILKEHA